MSRVRITAVVNQKGGVGKSTTAMALMSGLSKSGLHVLGVDLDAQGNITHTACAQQGRPSVLGVLTGEVPIADAIQQTAFGDLLPAHTGLAGADAFFVDTGKEYRLKEALAHVADRYDHIIVDTPPALGILSVNALTAAHGVLIPAQADTYSINGIERLADTLQPVRKYCNPGLLVDGILLTRFPSRSVLAKEVADFLGGMAQRMGTRLFRTTIREAVAVREAQAVRKPLSEYAPRSAVAADYAAFIEEFLGTLKERRNG